MRYPGQSPDGTLRLTRRCVLGAGAGLMLTRRSFAQAGQPAAVGYTTFDRKPVQLRPFVGRNIALLLDPARVTDRVVVDRVLSAVDRAWVLTTRPLIGETLSNVWPLTGGTHLPPIQFS